MFKDKNIRTILIIGHSNVGDVCYDLVVVNPLRRRFPQAKISFLTSSRCENIVRGYRGIDKIFTFDKHAKDKGLLGRFKLMARLFKERFDLAVVLKHTLMHRFLLIPNALKMKKISRGSSLSKAKHLVDNYLALLRSQGIDAQEAIFDFGLGEEEENFCEAFLVEQGISDKNMIIGILPMAAWSLKSWPIEQWNRLAELLKKPYGIKLLNLGKIDNTPLGKMLSVYLSREIISADKTTLKQAMALVKRCSLFIGPDSSLLHLASCLGVETIGLYGPSSGEDFYPYFHQRNIITAKEKRNCMPCYPSFKFCPCRKKVIFGKCMEDISVEDVLKVVRGKLNLS